MGTGAGPVGDSSLPGIGDGVRRERADLMRVSVFFVMVCPADGEALTIVPGVGVGGGEGLVDRKSGWMFCSRASARLRVDKDGELRGKVELVGEVWTRLSSECWTCSCRRLGMLRMLPLPRSRGRVSCSVKVLGMWPWVGDGSGEEVVEELVSKELCLGSSVFCRHNVPPE